jgi:pyridoxal phosphate enzyme (YggS family)
MKEQIAENAVEVRGLVAQACENANRDTDEITIVAVSKTFPSVAIKTAVAAGFHHIGESRIQEAEPKINELGRIAAFHLVGHLQTNKAKKAVQLFDVIQSVDSLKLAHEISRHAETENRNIECYVQVNCSGEDQKFGAPPEECLELLRKISGLPRINLTGLMTIGPLTEDESRIRNAFALCNELFKQGQEIIGPDFENLSMGMSDDFALAINEGATVIRLGTAIFGPRPSRI